MTNMTGLDIDRFLFGAGLDRWRCCVDGLFDLDNSAIEVDLGHRSRELLRVCKPLEVSGSVAEDHEAGTG